MGVREVLSTLSLDDLTCNFLLAALNDEQPEEWRGILDPFVEPSDLQSVLMALHDAKVSQTCCMHGHLPSESVEKGKPAPAIRSMSRSVRAHHQTKSVELEERVSAELVGNNANTTDKHRVIHEPPDEAKNLASDLNEHESSEKLPAMCLKHDVQISFLSGDTYDVQLDEGSHVIDLMRLVDRNHSIDLYTSHLIHDCHKLHWKDIVPISACLLVVRDVEQEKEREVAELRAKQEAHRQAEEARKRAQLGKHRTTRSKLSDKTSSGNGEAEKVSSAIQAHAAHSAAKNQKKASSFVERYARRSQRR